jgi:hypothetical protein
MQTAALIAAAVLGPAVGAVTMFNAWAVFVSCMGRSRAQSDTNDDARGCLIASCEK